MSLCTCTCCVCACNCECPVCCYWWWFGYILCHAEEGVNEQYCSFNLKGVGTTICFGPRALVNCLSLWLYVFLLWILSLWRVESVPFATTVTLSSVFPLDIHTDIHKCCWLGQNCLEFLNVNYQVTFTIVLCVFSHLWFLMTFITCGKSCIILADMVATCMHPHNINPSSQLSQTYTDCVSDWDWEETCIPIHLYTILLLYCINLPFSMRSAVVLLNWLAAVVVDVVCCHVQLAMWD